MPGERTLPTCYRHPDRETRLACSRCGRPACHECVRPAEVGQRCPDCMPRSASQTLSPAHLDPGGSGAPFTYTVLATAVAIFAAGVFVPDFNRVAFEFGAQFNQAVAVGQWHRLLTAAFLHAGMMHVLFNMFALYLFGPPLEREVGSASFAALYIVTALAGGVAFYVGGSLTPAVGASGAVFGLFGAWLAAFFRKRHTAAGQAGFRQLLLLLGINAALPLIAPGIAWEAHLGGLAAGFVITLAWMAVGGRAAAAALRVALAILVGAACLGLVVVL